MRPIVVGVDGSAAALQAVRWAALEAGRRAAALRLVHVCALVPPGHSDPVALLGEYADVLLGQGRQWLAEATDAARGVNGTLEIDTDLRDGVATKVLAEESAVARMVVLGSRGLGGFAELLVGSVAVTLAAHAHSPVVIVRSPRADSPPPVTGPVVVGVDGSPLSEAAIPFAFEAAAARGVPLRAVHTWLDLSYPPTIPRNIEDLAGAWVALPSIVDWESVHANEERILAERLAGWQEKYPTVEVQRIVTKDRPARALLRRAEDAQLIVVGSRGRGGVAGLSLGSVSQTLLHKAPCPVAVIRPEASQP